MRKGWQGVSVLDTHFADNTSIVFTITPSRIVVFCPICYNYTITKIIRRKVKEMQYPFGEKVHRLVQEDRSPKRVFVLGVYASEVHAKWKKGNKIICQALAVASEPRIFWDGNPEEAKRIIDRIQIPAVLGELIPASRQLNGPSA